MLMMAALAVSAPLPAGELEPGKIPASARWMLHADLDAMRESWTGRAVFDRIEGDHGAQLRAFNRMFGLHPLKDLAGLTLFGDGQPDQAVALISGKFDREHLEDVVAAADGYAMARHADFTIHTWRDGGVLQHAAFADDGLLVFSRQERSLKQALDTLRAEPAPPREPAFAAAEGRPLIDARALLSAMELPGDHARVLRMMRNLGVSAAEQDGRFSITMTAEAEDRGIADRMRRMVDGAIAFAEMGDPRLEGLDLRAELGLSEDEPVMSATVSLPVNEWLGLLDKAAAEARRLMGQ
jgi:hypothetical protein